MSELFDLFNGFALLSIPLFPFALPLASLLLVPVVVVAITLAIAAALVALPIIGVRRLVTP